MNFLDALSGTVSWFEDIEVCFAKPEGRALQKNLEESI
jgi:hypothetical protein